MLGLRLLVLPGIASPSLSALLQHPLLDKVAQQRQGLLTANPQQPSYLSAAERPICGSRQDEQPGLRRAKAVGSKIRN